MDKKTKIVYSMTDLTSPWKSMNKQERYMHKLRCAKEIGKYIMPMIRFRTQKSKDGFCAGYLEGSIIVTRIKNIKGICLQESKK